MEQFQDVLINLIKQFFMPNEPLSKESKRDVKGDFLDKVTPICVSILEHNNMDIENVSQHFDIPYKKLTFANLRDYKIYAGDYNDSHEPNQVVLLCREFMTALKTEPICQSQETIKNLSLAIADLFMCLNTFVLFYVTKKELPCTPSNNKKNQSPQNIIISRIFDKLVPLIAPKAKVDAVKLACQKSPTLQLNILKLAELKNTDEESTLNWSQLDTYVERKDFSPIATIASIRDTNKIYIQTFQEPVNFSVTTIPLVSSTHWDIRDNKVLDLVDQLQTAIGNPSESHHTIRSGIFEVQIGTVGHVDYIIDLLSVKECEIGLSKMTWLERIELFKRSFKIENDTYDNYKIISPSLINIGRLHMMINNTLPQYIILKTVGFGLYRSYYSSPKANKRVNDEKATGDEEATTEHSPKKPRF